jgi:very-short-patch-repair endonuclease
MRNLHPLMQLLAHGRGVVGLNDLTAAGLDRHAVANLCRAGVLRREAMGTYVSAAVRLDTKGRLLVAITAARQRAVRPELVAAARSSAAWLWKMTPQEREPKTLHIVGPHQSTPSPDLPAVRFHRSRTLEVAHLGVVDDVPLTGPGRTIVDSAINLGVPALREMGARGLQLDLVDLPGLSEQLHAAGRIRGGSRLRQAMLDLDPDVALAESLGEEAGFVALHRAGFEVVRQRLVRIGGERFRIDLAIVALRIAIEIDGYWWHSTPARHAADLRRQNMLTAANWRVLRLPAAKVLRDPEAVVSLVQSAMPDATTRA